MSDSSGVTEELLDAINLETRRIAIDLDQRIVLKTPVDTGRARSNWLIGLGKPQRGQRSTVDQGGGATIAANTREIQKSQPGQSIWISNNLPYIEDLENGTSRQARTGMVSVSLREIRRVFGTD